MTKRIIASILSLTMVVGMFAGCGKKDTEETTPTGDSSTSTSETGSTEKRTDLKLTIYGCVLEDYLMESMKQFEADTGVKTEGIRLGVGETLGRLRAEKENPQASVWFGGAAETFITAAEDNLLEPYVSPNAADIPTQYKDPSGNWTGFYIGYLGFACNEKLIKAAGLELPKTWEDLLDPAYKDQISMANPASSGTSYNLLATLAQVMGEEEAIAYMKKLDANVRNYEKSGTAPARLVGQGEAMVGITFLHDALKYKEEGMADIVVTTPETGTGYEVGCVAVVKDGPDQEAAKMFMDWLLEPEHLELGQKNGSYQFLTNPNAKQPEIADSIKDAKLIDFDYKYAGENRDKLVEMWSEAVGQ